MMTGTYNPALVLLSYLVAVIASYTALELARRVAASESKAAILWLVAGAFSMGIGIWTMHFVGMLAFSMPMAFSYDVPTTILSLLIGMGISAFALFIASRKSNSLPRICITGLILGCGIAGMHYTGMAAMRMPATIVYDPFWVTLSIIIAITAAIAAIWIAFTLIKIASKYLFLLKLGAAIIMGIAICGMHYTGMFAAKYQPIIGSAIDNSTQFDQDLMAISLAIAAVIILGFTQLTIFFDFRLNNEKKLGEKLSSMVQERTAELEAQKNEILHSKEKLEKEILQRAEAEKEVLYLSEILDESSNEIYIFSPETLLFVKVNKGALNNSGFSERELYSMTPYDIKPEYTKQSLEALLEPLRSGEKNHLVFESNLQRKDRSSYPVQVHLQLCSAVGGSLFVASITDMSEFKNMEQRLRQAEKMQSIGQLAAGVAHEINTPAQYVGDNIRFLKDGFADLLELNKAHSKLLKAAISGSLQKELLEETTEAVKTADIEFLLDEVPMAIDQSLNGISHISSIVRAMKEFSHPGSENKELVDLNQVISSTITVSSNEWKYVAEVESNLDPELTLVSCMRQEITQALLNLIVNAAHAIAEITDASSTTKGLIRITTNQAEDHIEVQIADSGCGIPEDIRKRIFDPFFTTKEVGMGTGQGLAMVYATIVDKHQGSLELESESGKGTTFTIHLPLEQAESLKEAV